ncbi:sterile alpha motif domain-containing protein 1-like, partial [Eubalaena glacialis]
PVPRALTLTQLEGWLQLRWEVMESTVWRKGAWFGIWCLARNLSPPPSPLPSPPFTAPTLPSPPLAAPRQGFPPLCGAPTVRPYIPPTFHRAVDPPTLPSVCRSAGPLEDLGPRPFLEHRTRPAPAPARQPASQPASQRVAHPSETSRLATVPEAQPGLAAWSPAHARLEDRLQLHQPEGRQEGRAATVRGGLPELVVWTPPLRSQPNRSSRPQRGSFFPCWIPTAIKETQAEILTAHARVEGLAHQSTSPLGAHKAGSLKAFSFRALQRSRFWWWQQPSSRRVCQNSSENKGECGAFPGMQIMLKEIGTDVPS